MLRLFTAIIPSPEIRASLLGMMGGINHARWQTDDQLHITTRYIGEVERPVAEDIAQVLQEVRAEPFTLQLRGLGSYTRKNRTTELWLAARPVDAIMALHRKIDNALIQMGLPPEGRAYRPHLTFARFPMKANVDVGEFVANNSDFMSDPFQVVDFVLFSSLLLDDGATYSVIDRYSLSGD